MKTASVLVPFLIRHRRKLRRLFKVTTITPNVDSAPNVVRVSPDGWTLWVADRLNETIDAFDLPLSPTSTPKQTVEAHDTVRDMHFDLGGVVSYPLRSCRARITTIVPLPQYSPTAVAYFSPP